jgi:hypothetical protein
MHHISEQSLCMAPGTPNWKAGDRLAITGFYDDAAHPQMSHGGKLHNVMAIAIAYVGQ